VLSISGSAIYKVISETYCEYQEVTMKLFKAETVAGILDISTARVYELIRMGILPAVKLGRQVRIEEQILEAWIMEGGQGLPGGWRWEDSRQPEDEPPW